MHPQDIRAAFPQQCRESDGGREAIATWCDIHQGYSGTGAEIPPAVVAALIESDVA